MDFVREQVALMMEHHPILTKLEGKRWYDVEDAIVNLIYELTGANEDFSLLENNPDLEGYCKNIDNPLRRQTFRNMQKRYHIEDIYYHMQDIKNGVYNENNEVSEEDNKKIDAIHKNIGAIADRYEEYLDYDWYTAMVDAIDDTLDEE